MISIEDIKAECRLTKLERDSKGLPTQLRWTRLQAFQKETAFYSRHLLSHDVEGIDHQTAECHVMNAELQSMLHEALSVLTDTQAKIISMLFFDELSVADTARILGVGATRVRVARDVSLEKLASAFRRKLGYDANAQLI